MFPCVGMLPFLAQFVVGGYNSIQYNTMYTNEQTINQNITWVCG